MPRALPMGVCTTSFLNGKCPGGRVGTFHVILQSKHHSISIDDSQYGCQCNHRECNQSDTHLASANPTQSVLHHQADEAVAVKHEIVAVARRVADYGVHAADLEVGREDDEVGVDAAQVVLPQL
jgi:hypothetical protein